MQHDAGTDSCPVFPVAAAHHRTASSCPHADHYPPPEDIARKGAFTEEDTKMPYLTDAKPLHTTACTYRIALGSQASQKVVTRKDPSLRLAPEVPQSHGCVPPKGSVCMPRRCVLPSIGSNSNSSIATSPATPVAPALSHERMSGVPLYSVSLTE